MSQQPHFKPHRHKVSGLIPLLLDLSYPSESEPPKDACGPFSLDIDLLKKAPFFVIQHSFRARQLAPSFQATHQIFGNGGFPKQQQQQPVKKASPQASYIVQM